MTPPFLTPQETEILRFIKRSLSLVGKVPSYRAIAVACGIKSSQAMQNIIVSLEAKGYLQRHGVAKPITLTDRAFRNPHLVELPDDIERALLSYSRAENVAPEIAMAEFARAYLGIAA